MPALPSYCGIKQSHAVCFRRLPCTGLTRLTSLLRELVAEMLVDLPLCQALHMAQVRCLHLTPISCRPFRQPAAHSIHLRLAIPVRIGPRLLPQATTRIFRLMLVKMACTRTKINHSFAILDSLLSSLRIHFRYYFVLKQVLCSSDRTTIHNLNYALIVREMYSGHIFPTYDKGWVNTRTYSSGHDAGSIDK